MGENMNAKAIRAKIGALLGSKNILELMDLWDMTETKKGPCIPDVRGFIMDELEKRSPKFFTAWMEANSPSPRSFYREKKPVRCSWYG